MSTAATSFAFGAAAAFGLRGFLFFFGFSLPPSLPDDPPSDPASDALDEGGDEPPRTFTGVTFFFPDVHGDGFKPFLKDL